MSAGACRSCSEVRGVVERGGARGSRLLRSRSAPLAAAASGLLTAAGEPAAASGPLAEGCHMQKWRVCHKKQRREKKFHPFFMLPGETPPLVFSPSLTNIIN